MTMSIDQLIVKLWVITSVDSLAINWVNSRAVIYSLKSTINNIWENQKGKNGVPKRTNFVTIYLLSYFGKN